LRKALVSQETPFLIAGVVEKGDARCHASCGSNSWQFSAYHPVGPRRVLQYGQSKHHRWQLTRSQIIQYGLGGVLNPFNTWWEHISLPKRAVDFMAVNDWLTFSVLICEDLARQEPVLEIVRAVGPNLVIALLMDGPQLRSRWSARYATVLADDPGCSVLTVTSIGMAELCKPHGMPRSRMVGLWKDGKTKDLVELELPQGSKALAISLAVESDGEWTADGRHDDKTSCFPVLAGLHPVGVQ